ncbi:MAG: hypothetical protein ACRDI3_03235 [Actinomycetota bacterium]
MKRTAYHVYVNSRPLLRAFREARSGLPSLPNGAVAAYMAGRFDGDGSWGTTPRIAYTTLEECQVDRQLLSNVGVSQTSALFYRASSEYCLYFKKAEWPRVSEMLRPHSWKLGIRNSS